MHLLRSQMMRRLLDGNRCLFLNEQTSEQTNEMKKLIQGATAVDKAKEVQQMASDVMEKSKVVAATSKRAIDIARKQRRAKEATTRATEKALRTFR